MPISIIAEAGVNHNGHLALAKSLAEAAKGAGADYVKYQTFQPQSLVSRKAKKAAYQKQMTDESESQLSMLQRLALSFEAFRELKSHCDSLGIGFLSTPFDLESIDFLASLDMPFWKIPSGEITNLPYLWKLARTGKPIVMSTGMCEMGEIGAALEALRKNGAGPITLLHCNTEYPTPYTDVNLRAMQTMRDTFNLPVGYSDHTLGIEISVAAAALGAAVIEKHFTLDRNMEGPDHKASLEPQELKAMIAGIRHVEQAMGSGEKTCSQSESKNISIARKSIVAACFIRNGEMLTEDNLTTKRPGGGVSPMEWFSVLGRRAERDYEADEPIER